VGDAKHLALVGDLPHALADGVGGFAADIGIDFIENQNGNGVLGGKNGLEREHYAGEFAGGGNGPQRPRGLAGVGRELEFNRVESCGFGLGGDGRSGEGDIELALGKAEIVQVDGDGLGEFGNEFFALGGEFFAVG
jgi:hypothetical protein